MILKTLDERSRIALIVCTPQKSYFALFPLVLSLSIWHFTSQNITLLMYNSDRYCMVLIGRSRSSDCLRFYPVCVFVLGYSVLWFSLALFFISEKKWYGGTCFRGCVFPVDSMYYPILRYY